MAKQPKRSIHLDLAPGRNGICQFGPFEEANIVVGGLGNRVDIALSNEEPEEGGLTLPDGKIFVDVYVMEEESAGDQGSDDGA